MYIYILCRFNRECHITDKRFQLAEVFTSRDLFLPPRLPFAASRVKICLLMERLEERKRRWIIRTFRTLLDVSSQSFFPPFCIADTKRPLFLRSHGVARAIEFFHEAVNKITFIFNRRQRVATRTRSWNVRQENAHGELCNWSHRRMCEAVS